MIVRRIILPCLRLDGAIMDRFKERARPAIACPRNARMSGPVLQFLGDKDQPTEGETTLRQRALRWIGPAAALVLIVAAAVVLWDMANSITLAELLAALEAMPAWRIAAAFALTLVGLAALATYDLVGLGAITTPHRISRRRAMAGGLVANIFANSLGFPMLTSGSARYRIYSMAGAGLPEVMRLIVMSWCTMWCGILFVVGLILMLEPPGEAPVTGSQILDRLLGLILFVGLFAAIAWMGRKPRSVRVSGWTVRLPGPRVALGMVAAGSVDLVAAAGTLYVLLPPDAAPDIARYMVAYSIGLVAGMLSNSPGGLGVFEAAVVTGLDAADSPDVAAGLILFRLIYFLLPLVLGLLLLGAIEARSRMTRR